MTPIEYARQEAVDLYTALDFQFSIRACFYCGQFGWCEHREPAVEIALIEKRWMATAGNLRIGPARSLECSTQNLKVLRERKTAHA